MGALNWPQVAETYQRLFIVENPRKIDVSSGNVEKWRFMPTGRQLTHFTCFCMRIFCMQREFFSVPRSIEPNLNCNYTFQLLIWHQTEFGLLCQINLEICNNNPKLVCFNKIQKRFVCV